MNALKDRLQFALDRRNKTAAGLARAVKKSESAVSQWLSGETKSLRSDSLMAACAYLSCKPQWLASNKGISGLDDPEATQSFGTPVEASKFKYTWVVGKGSGGLLPEILWSDTEQLVGSSNEYAEIVSSDPHAFIIEVDGPSMIPRFNPGEYALVEPSADIDIEDDVLVRLASGATMIKRLLARRGGIRLGSYNDPEVMHFKSEEVTWMYYVAYPVPAKKIKYRV